MIKTLILINSFVYEILMTSRETYNISFLRDEGVTITVDALCPVCGLETETVSHILWSCESAKDVWSECCGAIQKCSSIEVEFSSLFEILIEKFTEEEMQLMVGVARQIWLRRNAVVFGGEFLSPGALVKQASDQLEA